ncbi:hypothetical protein [Streptomyces sp. IBSBF 2390]|uniref:hypothetical protein n=1 Tax=Streptomyces sp. IBSBF 2390 TaxID=2903533 RepID=UPI002FDC157B
MRFHWDWMEAVMPVAYVPTLGPVRQGDPLSQLFEAVVDIAGTGRFLPYDKDRCWSATKTERVLVDSVEHDQRQTCVPTLAEVPVEAGRAVRGGEPKPGVVDTPPDVSLPCGEPSPGLRPCPFPVR